MHPTPSDSAPGRACVSLPKLKSLLLWGMRRGTIWVATHLDFSPSAHAHCLPYYFLGPESNFLTPEESNSFLSILSRKVQISGAHTPDSHLKDPIRPKCVSILQGVMLEFLLRMWGQNWPVRALMRDDVAPRDFDPDLKA